MFVLLFGFWLFMASFTFNNNFAFFPFYLCDNVVGAHAQFTDAGICVRWPYMQSIDWSIQEKNKSILSCVV